MKTTITKFIAAVIMLVFVFNVSAQPPKRNHIPNANFEDGLKHWRWDGLSSESLYSVESSNPISGSSSAKVQVLNNTNDSYNLQLYSFFPVEEYAKYKIKFKVKSAVEATFRIEVCESFDNQTSFKPINLESSSEGFITDNAAVYDLRGNITSGPEVKEYEFITKGDQFAFPTYILAFHFGHATKTTFWFDDIVISRVDDGEWDGNLFPTGDFESDRERVHNSQGYFLDGRTNNPESVSYLDSSSPISGSKSAYWYKSPTEDHGGYWELSYNLQFWRPDVPKLDISFKAKASGNTIFPMRLICTDVWAFGGGDVYSWEVPLNTATIDVRPNQNLAVQWLGKSQGQDYTSVSIPSFYWEESANINGHRGRMSLHGSFLDKNIISQKSAKGVGIWIDDVVIKESFLTLDKFTVEYAPVEVGVGQTTQFKINEFVYPTHAPTALDVWIENGTGKASIDENLVLTGTEKGTVTVYLDTPNMTDMKSFSVNVVDASSVRQLLNPDVITLSTTMANSGQPIEIVSPIAVRFSVYDLTGSEIANYGFGEKYIKTNNLASGVYLVNLWSKEGLQLSRKFIVK